MDLDTDLAQELESAIPHLPTAPPSSHLSAGRRARRRRRAYVGVAGVAALALVIGGAVSGLSGSSSTGADGTYDADSSSAAAIPEWAQEYGNHGPSSIYPDGRLWVAPDARLIRSVENPLDIDDEDVVSSYAVEAEMDGEVDWVVRLPGLGETACSARWATPASGPTTSRCGSMTSRRTGGPQVVSERLVHFAERRLRAAGRGPGCVIVDQTGDVVLPNWQNHPGIAVAKVTYEGTTWFVLAMDPAHQKPFYSAYERSVVSASTIDGFIDFLRDEGTDK